VRHALCARRGLRRLRRFAHSVAFVLSVPVAAPALTAQPAPPTRAAVIGAAREIIAKARYATFVTIGRDGHPQARIVDPFTPESDFTVWLATNPLTRKVAEIRSDSRVTLTWFDAAGQSYVTMLGRATAVNDAREKRVRWKEEWKALYKDSNRGDDYLLIRVKPLRLEVSSVSRGIENDKRTWRPATIEFPAR
jgi:general stress protein 26